MSPGIFLLFALLVAVFFFYLTGTKRASQHSSAIPDPVGVIHDTGQYSQAIVGESHYQNALELASGGRTKDSAEKYLQAHLVLEDSNPHDSLAVRVDIKGQTVGYLSRKIAREYRNRTREAGHSHLEGVCNAVIRGGWDRGPKEQGYFGVWLDLPTV